MGFAPLISTERSVPFLINTDLCERYSEGQVSTWTLVTMAFGGRLKRLFFSFNVSEFARLIGLAVSGKGGKVILIRPMADKNIRIDTDKIAFVRKIRGRSSIIHYIGPGGEASELITAEPFETVCAMIVYAHKNGGAVSSQGVKSVADIPEPEKNTAFAEL